MCDPVVARLRAWLKERESELLEDYREMLRIASIEGPEAPNAPFGQENREALDLALRWGTESGMATKDLDGYCGYAEFGSGDRLIGVFGHLDVVPVGPGWKHEPFGAEIDGDYVYARGAVDDKGPTMAAFYAARAIQACCPDIPARIRVVFGCDEESGFKCIEQYVAREEAPTFGIAPDAGWPLIHAEKGIANFVIRSPLPTGEMELLEINGGQRPNIVIDSCRAKIRVAPTAKGHIDEKLADSWDKNISFAWESSDVLVIDAVGKAAHGSWPYGGDNAAIRVFRFLMEIAPLSVQEAYGEVFSLNHIAGSGIGIDGRDDVSQDLTCNLGILETKDGEMEFTFNVRYPVTWNGDDMRARCETHLNGLTRPYRIADFHDSKPLYFPLEHPLVKTVCEVYAAETGDTEKKPGVMGGGTYARAVPNTVAIGTGWLGDGDAHQTDERCAIESLYKMSRIYAHIIWRLATV